MNSLKNSLEFLLPEDFQQIKKLGIPTEKILDQLQSFEKGTRFATLISPASIKNGIKRFTQREIDSFISCYEKKRRNLRLEKFVPASGAASRMFQIPHYFLRHTDRAQDIFNAGTGHSHDDDVIFMKTFIKGLEKQKFAFHPDLMAVMGQDTGMAPIIRNHRDLKRILQSLLTPRGLNYSQFPKALIKFHAYGTQSRTPLEEHLVEASQYLMDGQGITSLHITVSPEHLERIKQYLKTALQGSKSEPNEFRISFSIQNPNTNTIAVDEHNQPSRDSKGRLIFRPGGHGTLIGNLNSLAADLVFITNIDNVVPDHLKGDVVRYKKVLAGYLLNIQEKAFQSIEQLESDESNRDLLDQSIHFCRKHLNIRFAEAFENQSHKKKHTEVLHQLNRPIRVCGMVRNLGEPGGGPFWVADHQGRVSLQIIEGAQVSPSSDQQQTLLSSSTHFNPVDIICGLKNARGDKFNLVEFIDQDAFFIVNKSLAGKPIKALELPGLWNGAMANWITLFAEVPASTFNPVKTVNDLLRKQHQKHIRR